MDYKCDHCAESFNGGPGARSCPYCHSSSLFIVIRETGPTFTQTIAPIKIPVPIEVPVEAEITVTKRRRIPA